jgi:hypothetical protein
VIAGLKKADSYPRQLHRALGKKLLSIFNSLSWNRYAFMHLHSGISFITQENMDDFKHYFINVGMKIVMR